MATKNVILIGFMGTGKTSAGRILATKLGYAFLDLDQKIEDECGLSIPAIFAQYGEDYFRECEHKMVAQVARRRSTVISTGGGTVKNPDNLAMLRQNGLIVCLTADVDTILARTSQQANRPLLEKASQAERRQTVEKLLRERENLYATADYTVDTSSLSPLQVVDEVLHYYRRAV